MESEKAIDVEIQVKELAVEEETQPCEQKDAFVDDWDAPHNKENPRNWSAGESWILVFILHKQS